MTVDYQNNFRFKPTESWDEINLRRFISALSRLGYAEYCGSFNPLAPRAEAWQAHRDDAIDSLRPIIDLWLLGREVSFGSIDPRLSKLLIPLQESGLISVNEAGMVSTNGLVIYHILGLWLLFERPCANPRFYFGDNSIALLSRLAPPRHGVTLDLCAGPGLQALHCARHADHVLAVEIDPATSAIAKLNANLNDLPNIEVRCGDLFVPVALERFDHIVANPPLVPFPENIAYPFVGHGGEDGLRVTWRILEGLPAALKPDGVAQIIGTGLSNGFFPQYVDRLRECARNLGLDVIVTVVSHHKLEPGSDFFDRMVATARHATSLPESDIASSFRTHLATRAASHLCAHFMHAALGVGKVELQDLSRNNKRVLWHL